MPTYYLLASDNVKKVISLSSSVLYEAQYFGKETEYLFRPLFDIDSDFGRNSFISVYNDYFKPSFWSDILSPVVETYRCSELSLLSESKNTLRDLLNAYYGFAFLDKENILKDRIAITNQEIGSMQKSFAEIRNDINELRNENDRFKHVIDRFKLAIELNNEKRSLYLNYIKYYVLEHMTWGKVKDRYRQKRNKFSDKIMKMRL